MSNRKVKKYRAMHRSVDKLVDFDHLDIEQNTEQIQTLIKY